MKNFRLLLRQIKKTLIALRISMRGVSTCEEINFIIHYFDLLWVHTGPFKGMRYINSSYGSTWFPKILGTYEKEIAPIVAGLDLRKYSKIIDVGCAEGYYLSGLAMLASKSGASPEIVGYDLSEDALEMARNLLAINRVRGHVLNQRFSFDEQADEPNFYLVDIEGDERELFEGVNMDKFRTSDFLIEVHEPRGQHELLDYLKNAFARTHEASVVFREDRRPEDFPDVLGIRIDARLKLQMMDEKRCFGNTWLCAFCKERQEETR